MKTDQFCTYSVLDTIKKGLQSLETLVIPSSGNWIRTSDLRVISPNIKAINNPLGVIKLFDF